MARFDTEGIDDIIEDMKKLGELIGPTADKMLMAGAEADKKAWKQAAAIHGHTPPGKSKKATGEMVESVGFPRRPKTVDGIRQIDIYPQGKDKKGVRNAEKAFILHYGTSSIDGDQWVEVDKAKYGKPRRDAWCTAAFNPVKTGALRIEVRLKKDASAGILEWTLDGTAP